MHRLEFAEKQSITLALACNRVLTGLRSRSANGKISRSTLTIRLSTMLGAALLAVQSWAATESNLSEQTTGSMLDTSSASAGYSTLYSESSPWLSNTTRSKNRLINYSKICIDSVQQSKMTTRGTAQLAVQRFDTTDLSQIEQMATSNDLETLLLNSREHRFAQQLSPVNKLWLHPLDIYQQHNEQQRFIHGGSALGAMLRMSMKSWWKDNQDSRLHKVSAHAPESIRSGKLSGRSRYDWDYSLKLSYDDVKFKLEKEF